MIIYGVAALAACHLAGVILGERLGVKGFIGFVVAIVGLVLSVSSWYFFHEVLGVILPAGILDGVL